MTRGPNRWRPETVGPVKCFLLDTGPGPLVGFSIRTGDPADTGGDACLSPFPNAAIREAQRLRALVTLRQVHSDTVVEVSDSEFVSDAVEGDALMTMIPGVGLGIKVADCLPAYFWDAGLRSVGLAHCGWRGTAAGIAPGLARALSARLEVSPRRLRFALGPCICHDCYEVGPEVAERFEDLDCAVRPSPTPGSFRLDLRAAVRGQLLALGLHESSGLQLCTRENPATCFSHRRDHANGRNVAFIALR
ncbi:MAG TPA: laccase domain-containing protein [candidate division WOR-3 bacterium]|uniref:Laccase domain-containing protein n=1 Tax=candidate division WOR-3 bacterium TaxID=2052148 RepID=A0A7V0XFE0_UNCW3|nr:laccase domain-containing protein [candidate division WOR-3 bacterium]